MKKNKCFILKLIIIVADTGNKYEVVLNIKCYLLTVLFLFSFENCFT